MNFTHSSYMHEIDADTEIKQGNIIRRICSEKDQQGRFMRRSPDGGIILMNVVDLKKPAFAAEAGIIRPEPEDRFFIYKSAFSDDSKSQRAMELLKCWPLYIKNEELRPSMTEFFRTAFSPEQVLELSRTENLSRVFIPMQQKFRIGRFEEKIDQDRIRKEKFRSMLDSLKPGDHITYLALVPQTSSYRAKFYSIGTRPHEETHMSLKCEGFNFKPTHGGHIKAVKAAGGKEYLVDAGSSYIGKGIKTRLETARAVTDSLKREYRSLKFLPVEGRGAFGTEQSY